MGDWSFYGRAEPLAELRRVVESGRWFFCRIEGRRRIGKTSLLGEMARRDGALADRLVYMQVPDSDERDVAYTFVQSLRCSGIGEGLTYASVSGLHSDPSCGVGRNCCRRQELLGAASNLG